MAAENEKTIIYSVKIDMEASKKALAEYTQLSDKAAKEQKENTEELKKSTEVQTEVINKTKKALDAEVGSIASLRQANKDLTTARNNTTLATEEGRKKVDELNRMLDQNNTVIKANVDQYTKQKIGIGDYTSGILKAIPGMGNFATSVGGINTALKANPIGFVVTALFALKSIFEKNAAFADKLSFAVGGFNKGLGFVIDKIYSTVTSLDNLTEAFKSPVKFIKELFSGTAQASVEGYKAAESIDAFTASLAKADQQIQLTASRIEALKKQLKDRTQSEQDRIKIATEIADLEILNSKRVAESKKAELDNIDLLNKGRTLSGDQEAERIRKETEFLVALEEQKTIAAKRTSTINILLEKEAATEKRLNKENEKQDDLDLVKHKEIVVGKLTAFDDLLAKHRKNLASEQKDYHKEYKIASTEEEKIAKSKTNAMSIMYSNLGIALSGFAKHSKAAAIGLVVLEKFKSISAIVSNIGIGNAEAVAASPLTFGQPWVTINTIIGAAAVAASVENAAESIAAINAQPFAKGGIISGTKITSNMGKPIRRANGDDRLITGKVGEVILNEDQQRRLGGDSVFKSLGVPGFYDGGRISDEIELQQAVNYSNQLTGQAQSQMTVAVIMEEIEYKQLRKNKNIKRATVI